VVEVDEETALKVYNGTGIQSMKAPVWKPHSMWNCYPDPSPSTLGTNTFYNGSMIIKDYMPLYLLKEQKGEGWMRSQIPKVKKKQNKNKDVETQDIELVKYFGDITIPRQDGDILLPNSEVILANGTIVYYSTSKLPFPRIIYNGYERMDVRDPYYTSPLIKTAPTAKMASRLANKALDSVDLWVEPPLVYDGNDPNFVQSGGPVLAPGSKTPTKALANFKEIKVGDPQVALSGLEFILDQVRQSTSVDAERTGGGSSVERSATASRNKAQRGEVRVVDFVSKLDFSLKTFLYMQHEFNKVGMNKYSFYNPEMDAPDFAWMTKKDLPSNVHFEVVGSKGILGEEERSQKTMAVTAMAAGSELFASLLDPEAIIKQAYMDAGNKNPEQFLKQQEGGEFDAIIEQIQSEAQAVISQYEEKIFELEKDIAIQRAVNGARVAEAQIKAETQANISEQKAELQAKLDILDSQLKLIEAQSKNDAESEETKVTIREIIGAVSEIQNAMQSQSEAISQVAKEMEDSVEERFSKTDQDVKALLDKVNRPMSEKIKEAKAALMESKNG
jgi:Mg2+ and Co2+ transporter CorA